ncbi:MAG TPA: nuclear transport factor 2 family protein [Candidatus Dormibacteraeota bacterium]
MSDTTIAGALSRLEKLEAERDIVHTLYAYSHHLDLGQDEKWADCFTEDGVIDIHYLPEKLPVARVAEGTRHAKGIRHKGRRQLLAFVAGHDHPPAHVFKHLMIEPRITVDGDTGTGTAYLVRVDDVGGVPRITSFGRYVDRYRRVGPGEWRIEERVVELEGAFPGPRGNA